MINFFTETEFELQHQDFYKDWLHACADRRDFTLGNVNFIFCDDDYLLEINRKHLNHDFYTDIITFDYTELNELHGDIFISIDRIADNTHDYGVTFDKELARVMIHGLLHMMGVNDKSENDKIEMRREENLSLELLYHIDEEE